MSKKARDWAHSLSIDDGAMKPVLMELAYIHQDGKPLFPSQDHLARATGNSERTVRDALRLLQHFKIISRKARSNGAGGRTSDEFTLSIGETFSLSRKQIAETRKALSNRRNLPLASANSQPAKSAGGTGEICRGIGDLVGSLSQDRTDVSVGHCAGEGAQESRPHLRLVSGGRS